MEPTDRQKYIFEIYCKHGDYNQAASELDLSVQTVKNAVSALYHVLGVKKGVQAAYVLWRRHEPYNQ